MAIIITQYVNLWYLIIVNLEGFIKKISKDNLLITGLQCIYDISADKTHIYYKCLHSYQ